MPLNFPLPHWNLAEKLRPLLQTHFNASQQLPVKLIEEPVRKAMKYPAPL